MYKPFLLAVILCSSFSAFAQQKANPEAPKESYMTDVAPTERLKSIISIPFSVAMTDVEKQINTAVPALIYEDKSHSDNGNDLLKMKVWKNGQIVFTAAKNDVFDFTVPLKIWAEKGLSIFGMTQYRETTFEMNLKFSSRFIITSNWDIQTVTVAKGYEWKTKPSIKIGSVDVPITAIIGKLIDNNQAMIARQIDETVAKNMSIKPYVLEAWNAAQKPYLVSEEYKTWVKMTPIDIMMEPLRTEGRVIRSKIGFTTYTETSTGVQPAVPPTATAIPALKLMTNIPDDFKVALLSTISYEEATAIAKKNFVGEKYEFSDGRYQITVTDMNIYGSDQKLVIQLETKGDLKGKIFLAGTPVYDSIKKQIVLTDTQLDIKTRNVLVKAASWILGGMLERKVQEEFGMPVEELLTYGKQNVETALNTEWMKGVKLHGKINQLQPDKVVLSQQGITAIVKAEGKLSLDVDGM
jgi:Domain of unknown function (DUF4403)